MISYPDYNALRSSFGGPDARRKLAQRNFYENSDEAVRGMSYEDWLKVQSGEGGAATPATTDPRVSSMEPTPAKFGQNLAQYMPGGWAPGFQPSPYGYSGQLNMVGFQPGMYNWAYPDVRNSGLDPLQHYLGWGMAEGRQGQLGVPGQTAQFGAPFVQGVYGGGPWGGQQAQTMPAPQWAGAPFVGSNFNLGMGQQPMMGARPAGSPPPSQEMMDRFAPARTDTKTFGMPQQQGPGGVPMPQQQAAPFGQMGLQAFQQQLGGQIGGILQPQQAQSAPQTGANRYEQRFIDQASKQAQETLAKLQRGDPQLVAGISPQQRAALEAMAAGNLPPAIQAQMAKFADRKLARDANPLPLPPQPAGPGPRPLTAADQMGQAQAAVAKMQPVYDQYQAAMAQFAKAGTKAPAQLQQALAAMPAGARGAGANLSPEQVWAIAKATGQPWHSLGDVSMFQNGLPDVNALAQQMAAKQNALRSRPR